MNKEIKMNMEAKSDLNPFFEPKNIAVIGSLSQPWFGGPAVLRNLQRFGYPGKVFLVNPSYNRIRGMKVYPTIKEVPEPIDLAIIITRAETVPSILKECAEASVKGAIIGSDGFAERDERGKQLQKEIVDIGRRNGIRILGPNTVGTVNTKIGFVPATYVVAYSKFTRGNIAFAAQTGIIGPQAVPYEEWGHGISKICDFGNKSDVNECDLLEYLADDPETKVIAMHIEGVKEGRRFLKIAKEVAAKKPIMVYKPGRTEESAKALQSHTGSLAGDRQICESAFKQAGIIQVNSFKELMEIPRVFSSQPLPKGNRVGIVTVTGGAAIMAMDTLMERGLKLAKFSGETLVELAKIDPTIASNPADLGPFLAQGRSFPQEEVIQVVMNDENVDCVFAISVPPSKIEKRGKPVVFWLYGPSARMINDFVSESRRKGFPVYDEIEIAAKALGAMYRYQMIKQNFN